MLHNESTAVLKYIKANPGKTALEITEALKANPVTTATSLHTLWSGGYVKRVKGDKKNAVGLPLFEYTFKAEKPRGKGKHKVKHTHVRSAAPAKSENTVEILVAIKGKSGTETFTLDQARALVRAFKHLGM